jgi:hypothetical protein
MTISISDSGENTAIISPNIDGSPGLDTYSISTSSSASKKKGRKRSHHNKVVIHDIFMKCAEVVKDDIYWKDLFINAAYGKFISQPYYVKDGILIYSKGTTVNQLKISSEPEKAATECIDFFKTTGGHHSGKDAINEKAKRHAYEQSIVNSDVKIEWNNFSRTMRKFMISKYCDKLEKEYELTKSEKDSLYDLLVTGMSIGYLCKATVKINDDDNIVDSINCITWDEKLRKFHFSDIPKAKQVPRIVAQNPLPLSCDIALTYDKASFEDSFIRRMGKHFDNAPTKKSKNKKSVAKKK